MRTIRVELVTPIPDQAPPGLANLFGTQTPSVRISTEVVISDETEEAARQAGQEAREAINAFIAGYAD